MLIDDIKLTFLILVNALFYLYTVLESAKKYILRLNYNCMIRQRNGWKIFTKMFGVVRTEITKSSIKYFYESMNVIILILLYLYFVWLVVIVVKNCIEGASTSDHLTCLMTWLPGNNQYRFLRAPQSIKTLK